MLTKYVVAENDTPWKEEMKSGNRKLNSTLFN